MKNLNLLDNLSKEQKNFITAKAEEYNSIIRVYANEERIVIAVPYKVKGWTELLEAGKENILIPTENLTGYMIAHYPYMEKLDYTKAKKYHDFCNEIIERLNEEIGEMQGYGYSPYEIQEVINSDLENELEILKGFKKDSFIKQIKKYILSRI